MIPKEVVEAADKIPQQEKPAPMARHSDVEDQSPDADEGPQDNATIVNTQLKDTWEQRLPQRGGKRP